jgi:mRNA interferase RelE/StbE
MSSASRRLAVKKLDKPPRKDRPKIVQKIRALASEPRPQCSEKLSTEEKYRAHQGDYRVAYSVDDDHRISLE